MGNIYRDKIISEISESDVGSELRVCGWIENIRDHGGVSFIDLRDMYGTLQVVMRDTTLLDGLVKEECISIEGKIEHRDEETYNPKIATGTIELEAHKVDVLGKVYTFGTSNAKKLMLTQCQVNTQAANPPTVTISGVEVESSATDKRLYELEGTLTPRSRAQDVKKLVRSL